MFVRLRKYGWVAVALAAIALAACSGDDGEDGADGTSSIIGVLPASSATSLKVTIDEVEISSPPVVSFTATDGNDIPVAGLKVSSGGNLRFTIATLIPGTNGDPSYWKNYVVSGNGQATYERDGTLTDHGNGRYTYTFENDVTSDPDYSPSRTHRLAMQIDGFPATNPSVDFRPDGGAVTVRREIVKTETCNSCHNKLAIHGGGRIEARYCVTCHTPATIDPDTGNTVDFKVMIHKIHRGEDLPSVIGGTPYQIIGFRGSVHDYSTVVYPQDIRNCAKCHNSADPDTPQGGNWSSRPSMQACGSCHDDIDFSKDRATEPDGHSGGVVDNNSECLTCHATNRIAGSIAQSHAIPEQLEATKYEFNIHDVTGAATPSIQISVTDPSKGDAPYDLGADPFTGGGARLALIIGWGLTDFDNSGGATSSGFPNFQATAALPLSIDPVAACGAGIADWTCDADTPVAGTYTLTKSTPLPGTAVGTGRVGFEGHVAADFDEDLSFDDEVAIRSVVRDFVITGSLASRREVVDIDKCNNCHEQLSLHGGNRNDEPALCVICHNPNATDTGRRPALVTDTTDGKAEETIDFKVLIHAIHAGAKTNFDASEAHGVRESGLVVWGFPGAPCNWFGGPPNNSCEHDYSHVRYPGILQDCESCHKQGTWELDGDWASPTANGVLSTTITTTPDNTVPTDDLNISPTAAVCSSCHDDDVARAHMINLGGAVFDQTQAVISGAVIETCSVCHGPGHIADVAVSHGLD